MDEHDDPGEPAEPEAPVGSDEPDDDADEPFERPVDRFRRGAVGGVLAAGLLGIADALEGRPAKEEVVIVQEAPSAPPREPRRLELLLDPDDPSKSLVFLPDPASDADGGDGTPRPALPTRPGVSASGRSKACSRRRAKRCRASRDAP